jgi:bifunctional DNA-binding transcriptional regulator/antitoxin component of YhaV-PrlF toxin-antitoxin module
MTVLDGKTKNPSRRGNREEPPVQAAPRRSKVVEVSAKLTSKNQTTIPTPVRTALGLEPLDRIKFQILPDGRVELTKDSAQEEEFDPMVHEALTSEAVEGIETPTVMSVYQPGYRFAGRVLRPARVAVAGTD